MQHTLTFKHDNKKYVSKPFDFEAMCIINDAHNDENKNGPLNICREAVDYMFEGTDATQDIIDAIDVGTHSRLCIELWKFYIDALTTKNESRAVIPQKANHCVLCMQIGLGKEGYCRM